MSRTSRQPHADIPKKRCWKSEKLAVLATHRQGQPHTSLVAFAATADGRELIFATTRTSRKFANLQADGRAALLIDSRTHQETDFHLGQAVSATGTVIELPDLKRLPVAALSGQTPSPPDFVNLPPAP